MKEHVTHTMHDKLQADAVVHRLIDAGFRDADITVRLPHVEDTTESPNAQRSRWGKGALVGAGLGALAGGIAGLLAGMGLIVIPTVGPEPFFAAGPALGALTGIIAGAGFCGVAGWIVGLSLVHKDAHLAEPRDGRPLVSVVVKRVEEKALAEAVFSDSMTEPTGS
jgi:hypothetical protein